MTTLKNRERFYTRSQQAQSRIVVRSKRHLRLWRPALFLSLLALFLLGGNGVLHAAGLGLNVSSIKNGSQLSISWNANLGVKYKICWKIANTGDACASGSHQLTHTPTVPSGSNWSGVASVDVGNTKCGGTQYKVKVKRVGSPTNATTTVKTGACSCANRCPAGGWDDGANCQMGQAPTGTTAFIWQGAYYHSYVPAGLGPVKCPIQGSLDDTANCYVKPVPAGVQPFIWQNHWYYKACPW